MKGETMPVWAQNLIWYHIYPLGFLGAEPTNPHSGIADGPVTHRLARLEEWLDYLVNLGATGIQLGPVFESESHGYDTVDYFRVDRRLGDEADLVRLFDACHTRGLRVLLDGVFNHVGRRFPAFVDVQQRREASPSATLFRVDFNRGGPAGFAYQSFEGHDGLVVLNHASDDVLDLTTGVANYWLERGADGFRLDAAYAVPVDFWRRFTARVRHQHPDAFFVAELIHGDYAQFVKGTGVDSATQYELWKSIWSSLNDRNFFELDWTLKRHEQFCATFRPYTFIGNHDVTRIASQLNDIRHLPHAVALLMTLPGTPAIYYGDEQGWQGMKYERLGGDDEIRPAFPDHPDDLGSEGQHVYRLYQDLTRLRRERPWLATAAVEVITLSNQQMALKMNGSNNNIVLLLLNLADESWSANFPWEGAEPSRVISGYEAHRQVDSGKLEVRNLPPHAWSVLERG